MLSRQVDFPNPVNATISSGSKCWPTEWRNQTMNYVTIMNYKTDRWMNNFTEKSITNCAKLLCVIDNKDKKILTNVYTPGRWSNTIWLLTVDFANILLLILDWQSTKRVNEHVNTIFHQATAGIWQANWGSYVRVANIHYLPHIMMELFSRVRIHFSTFFFI